jgi:hypothetical protein
MSTVERSINVYRPLIQDFAVFLFIYEFYRRLCVYAASIRYMSKLKGPSTDDLMDALTSLYLPLDIEWMSTDSLCRASVGMV